MSQSSDLIQSAQRTIRLEVEAVQGLLPHIDARFRTRLRDDSGQQRPRGRGRHGQVRAHRQQDRRDPGQHRHHGIFVHPAEASHGDMGMITRDDIILALSDSGSTNEIVTLLPLIKRLGIQLISMTGNPDSAAGQGRRGQPERFTSSTKPAR